MNLRDKKKLFDEIEEKIVYPAYNNAVKLVHKTSPETQKQLDDIEKKVIEVEKSLIRLEGEIAPIKKIMWFTLFAVLGGVITAILGLILK